ncbi:hypothetical protein J2S53_001236 [Actinopolyspora lacussalsi]|nr:hypothetical protein [Actinopolyspora lacussalsi]
MVRDRNGFLEPPRRAGRCTAPMAVSELVGSSGDLVLLAPGGAGKTTVLEALREAESGATVIDFTLLDVTEAYRALAAAAEYEDGVVHLDGVDAVAGDFPGILEQLRDWLRVPGKRRARLRLACRTTTWNRPEARVLRRTPLALQVFELLPLTRDAADSIARGIGVSEELFTELAETGSWRPPASAMWFEAVARHRRDTGELPSDQRAAIEHDTDVALGGTGSTGAALTRRHQWQRAMWLAAVSIFGNVSPGEATGGGESGSGTPVGESLAVALPEEAAPSEQGGHEEVLDTALFAPARGGGVEFRLRQHADYLAACFVVSRQLERDRLGELLGVHDNGRVPGSLAAVTAWTANMDPELVQDLIPANAALLARTGVEPSSDRVRATMTESLLTAAAEGELEAVQELDLATLVHPGLQRALLGWLRAGIEHSEQLWWIARLAEEGRCRGTVPELLEEVLSPRWSSGARRAGAMAVVSLSDESAPDELASLLRLEPEEDPDEELLAAGIDALYPGALPTAELLDSIRRRGDDRFEGSYWRSLETLADRIPVRDLPQALAWGAECAGAGEQTYGRFIIGLLDNGWRAAESLPSVVELADVTAAVINHNWSRWRDRVTVPRLNDPRLRRELAVLLAERIRPDFVRWLLLLDLVGETDIEWILEVLPRFGEKARSVLGGCVPLLVAEPDARSADLILSVPEEHPAYPHIRELRENVASDSGRAEMLRKMHRTDPAPSDEEKRAKQRRELTEALQAARRDVAEWWQVCRRLAEDGGWSIDHYFTQDLTERPGWELLAPEERRDVFDLGLEYVRTHRVTSTSDAGLRHISTEEVLPDWSGVYLLSTLLRHQPHRLDGLDTSTWSRWAPPIIAAWILDEADEDAGLRGRLIDSVPHAARPALAEAVLLRFDEQQKQGKPLENHHRYASLLSEIDAELHRRFLNHSYHGVLGETLLRLLDTYSPELATRIRRELRRAPEPELATLAYRAQAESDPNVVVADLVSGAAVSARADEVVAALDPARLHDRRLAELTRWLLDRFPITRFPERAREAERENHWISSAHSVRDESLEELTTRARSETLAELRDERTGFERRVLTARLSRARAHEADLAHTPPSVERIRALCETVETRTRDSDAGP